MAKVNRIGVKVPPTASEVEAQRVVEQVLLNGLHAVGAKFDKPDDDWWPMWLVLTSTQGTMITPENMRNEEEKVKTVRTVAAYARKVGATAIGAVNSSWRVRPETVSPERMLEILAHVERFGGTAGVPEREEALVVTVYTATTYRVMEAAIVRRDDGPPTLGRFEVTSTSDSDGHELLGRMVMPLRESLRRYG
jgi:hypothetical protein